jgi:hypothetical protein
MSECLDDQYADRRRHTRRSVYRTAELMVRDRADRFDCTVLDESDGGVQVELEQAMQLPEELTIKFSDTASQLVRRCWARGTRAGYQYIDVVPAERRWVDNVPPPPLQAEAGLGSFVAFNDFVHISRPLLELAGEPTDWLYPADEIHAQLAAVAEPPVMRSKVRRLFALARADEDAAAGELFFGPRWLARG